MQKNEPKLRPSPKPSTERELMDIVIEHNLRRAKESRGVENWKTAGDYYTELSRAADVLLEQSGKGLRDDY